MPTDTAALRCFDDTCRQRHDCQCYLLRASSTGPLAMTWRHGNEDHALPCHQYQAASADVRG